MISSSTRAIVTASLVAALAPLASAGAQTFSDGNLSTFTSSVVVNPNSCSAGSSVASPAGGNPDAYLAFGQFTCGYVGLAHMSAFSWNPSTQGAITKFGTGYDVNTTGSNIAFITIVRQGGNYFVNSDYTLGVSSQWTTFANTDEVLTNYDPMTSPTGWCNIYQAFGYNNIYTCGNAVLDFSATGGQIDFGVESANSGGVYSTAGGIDNFHVELEVDAPVDATPEPATLVLLGTGLIGVAAARRRRNR